MKGKITAGLVGLGYEGYSLEYVDKITKRVTGDLKKTGQFNFKLIPKIQNNEQCGKSIETFSSAGCDLLIAVVASWLDARGSIPFFIANKQLPVLLYGTGGRTQNGVLISPAAGAGAPGILEPMRSAGINFEYMFEEPDEKTKVDDILKFAKSAKAVNDLKKAKIGSMGFADMGLYTTNFDNTALRDVFGVQTDFFDMLEVENKIKTLKEPAVRAAVLKLKKEWKFLGTVPKEETFRRLAEIYLAVRAIIKEKNLSAFSLKCVEGMMACMNCAPCMVGTLLGDESYYVCECDVPGMLGHVILHSLTDETVTFVESYEFWKDRILFGVCGFLPESMIEGPKLAKIFRSEPWEGVMNCSKMKTGRVTLIRPFFRDGKFRIHLVTGKAVAPRKWIEIGFKEPGYHPSVEIILDGTIKHFVDHVPAQHFSLVYGDRAGEVAYLCKILGLELIYENK